MLLVLKITVLPALLLPVKPVFQDISPMQPIIINVLLVWLIVMFVPVVQPVLLVILDMHS